MCSARAQTTVQYRYWLEAVRGDKGQRAPITVRFACSSINQSHTFIPDPWSLILLFMLALPCHTPNLYDDISLKVNSDF